MSGWVMRMVQDMRSDPAAPFCTESFARKHEVSSSALIRAFKQKTGLSPLRFRAAVRIEEAKRLLLQSDQSITTISLDVGYNSFGTFVRTFTAMVGLSPTRFRQLARTRLNGDLSDVPEADLYERPEAGEALTLHCRVGGGPENYKLIAAGLFPQAVPAGWPLDGCLATSGQVFELRCPRTLRRVTVLVAALSNDGASQVQIWGSLPGNPLVAARSFDVRRLAGMPEVHLDLRLRRVMATDPPLLMPLPLLMAVQARRVLHCQKGRRPEAGMPIRRPVDGGRTKASAATPRR